MPDRRTLLAAGLTAPAAALVASATGSTAAAAAPSVKKVLAAGLRVPWGLAFLPNGDALVGERPSGRVHRVRAGGGRSRVGTLSAVRDRGEGGLLGIAVSPTFDDDRWVYFYFTTGADNRVVRKRFRNGELGRTHVLLDGIPAASNHNGGRLAFGPDGMLYASTGDAGDTSLDRDKKSLGGKIPRLAPDGGVPDDNPFDTRIWSFGHRNVQGLAWDRDVGCGPPSWVRATGASSTGSDRDATTAGRRSRGATEKAGTPTRSSPGRRRRRARRPGWPSPGGARGSAT